MSVLTLSLPELAISPRVWREGPALHARTRTFYRLLTAFGYDRHLIVDPTSRRVTLTIRRYWAFGSRETLCFDDVTALEYRYASLPTAFGVTLRGLQWTDSVNWYVVSLALRTSREPIVLFRFAGEGAEWTGWSGGLLGDELLDVQGTQEIESREFVDRLRRLLNVPMRSRMERMVSKAFVGRVMPCPHCERSISVTAPRCTYCGKALRVH